MPDEIATAARLRAAYQQARERGSGPGVLRSSITIEDTLDWHRRTYADAAAILAWCDHVDAKIKDYPRAALGTSKRIYQDGLIDGTVETLAQVRQAVLHDFDIAALDGKALT